MSQAPTSSPLFGQAFRLPKLMGILNITPDSFSDGGSFLSPGKAVKHARLLQKEGADFIDIGAESTRPGFIPVRAGEEIQRLRPVLSAIQAENIPFSIDSYKAETVAFALHHGAEIVNDIGGLQHDSEMARTIADFSQQSGKSPFIIIMQSETSPTNIPLTEQFQSFFEKSLTIADKVGIPLDRLILDPGIGFGKTPEQNMECLQLIPFLKQTYRLPVLIGLSKKRFLKKFSPFPQEAHERLPATLGADLFAALKGADILRVHDISAHFSLLRIFKAFLEQDLP